MKLPFAIVALILVLTGCTDPEPTALTNETLVRPAKVGVATSTRDSTQRTFLGTIEAAQKSDLAFRVGGQLVELPAIAGMSFEKGDLLAKIDKAEYVNTLNDRQAKYYLAKTQYEKQKKLKVKNFVSGNEVDQAEASLKAAAAALALAQDDVKHTELIAPFSGVISAVSTENHQIVSENNTIMQLHNEDFLDIRFNVPESLLGKLDHIDDPRSICAQVVFNAYPQKTYRACFKEFESKPDPLTRSYSVVHTMPRVDDFPVLPGMAVTVKVDLSSVYRTNEIQGVTVPVEAVFELNDTTYVWKLNDHSEAHKLAVSLGKVEGKKIIIHQGLNPGDKIIIAGVSFIQEGQQVVPLEKERGL